MSDTQLKIILKENIVKNIVVSQEKKNSPDFAHGKKISRSIFVHTQFHSPIGFFFAWKSFFSFLFFFRNSFDALEHMISLIAFRLYPRAVFGVMLKLLLPFIIR